MIKNMLKLAVVAALPVALTGCGWLVHTTSCVVTLTIIC